MIIKLFNVINIILLCIQVFYAQTNELAQSNEIKNIIFFIGDGMGITQVTATSIKKNGPGNKLAIEKLPFIGLMKTHAADNFITDSAAGSTAMATGYKTRNKMIGMKSDSTKVLTILEAAKQKGASTGLVATSSITHATPACFASHVISRYEHSTIAEQLIQINVGVLLGGGKQFFIPNDYQGSKRKDDRNLIQEAETNGYIFVETGYELKKIKQGKVLGLFQDAALKTFAPEPSLAEMTATAIEILNQNPKGFFLMVEGSQIDWAGHDNEFDTMVRQMFLFDDAVQVGLDFAEKSNNTLILVTADHETGGLDIVGGSDKDNLKFKWNSGSHTGQMVPIFAYGPGSNYFTGVKDNTEIAKIFAKLLEIENFPRTINSLP